MGQYIDLYVRDRCQADFCPRRKFDKLKVVYKISLFLHSYSIAMICFNTKQEKILIEIFIAKSCLGQK